MFPWNADMLVLKPCPFCGSTQVAMVFGVVRCGQCSCSGPSALTEKQAAIRWNERVPAPDEPPPQPSDALG